MIVKRAVEKAKPHLEIERLLSKTVNALKDRKRSAILPGVFLFACTRKILIKKFICLKNILDFCACAMYNYIDIS